MRQIHSLVAGALFAVVAAGSGAAVTPMDWTSETTGTLAGADVALSGLSSPFLAIREPDLSDADFSAGPLGRVEAVEYGASNDWTASFSEPISDLLLYVVGWRGDFLVGPGDPPVNYTFGQPFTIVSGLGDAIVNEQTLTLREGPPTALHSGILRFAGPLTSLSVESSGQSESGQLMTFAPEPSRAASVGSALATLLIIASWRAARRPQACA